MQKQPRAKGQPTVILAKTVKGMVCLMKLKQSNKTHQIKKMQIDSLNMRDRFNLPFMMNSLRVTFLSSK